MAIKKQTLVIIGILLILYITVFLKPDMKQYLIDSEDKLLDTTKDSLKYLYGVDNVIEENSQFIKLLSKQRKDDHSVTIGGIKYKYYVDNDNTMHIRKARHQ